jgi:ABC-type antimicrobial peptide transport system permease subunit
LGITEGGVNTTRSTVVGIFEPAHYTSVFDYINFLDAESYAKLFDYSGVESLPPAFDKGLSAADAGEGAIFGLAKDPGLSSLDLSSLKPEALSGATMVAVRLKDHGAVNAVLSRIAANGSLGVKAAAWDKASGFYAQIAQGLQAFIYLATALVFLVVVLIFMNTLIINVTERTAEIGTMRAIGAEKSFIRGLFLAEAFSLNLFSAFVGMVATLAALLAFSPKGVQLPEIVSQFLIGGGPLRLVAGPIPCPGLQERFS